MQQSLPTKVQKPNSDMACPSSTWASGLSVSGLYYQGVVERDQLEKVLELHKRDTVSTFGTRYSSRVSCPVPWGQSYEGFGETKQRRFGGREGELKYSIIC